MCLTVCYLVAFGLKGKEARTQARVVAYWIALDLLDLNNGHLTEVT